MHQKTNLQATFFSPFERSYRCEGELKVRELYHAVVASCLPGDHLLPLRDQRDWGGFGENVRVVSHHTPFHRLHLKEDKIYYSHTSLLMCFELNRREAPGCLLMEVRQLMCLHGYCLLCSVVALRSQFKCAAAIQFKKKKTLSVWL